MNNSGSDSRNTSGSLLQEGDVANHPFASTFSVEVPQPCAPDLHATLDTPEQHSMHTAALCKPQLDNAATDTAGAHIMQWQLPVQQQQQQQQQEGGSIDADSVPPAYNPTPASPFHAWGLSSAAAGALTSSPSLQEVNQQHQSHHNHLHQQLPQHGSGSRDDSGDTVGSDDGNGAGSVVLGEESSERELWRWAQDSPTRNASHTVDVDPSVHCGCGSSACVCDPAAEEAEHTQASPSLPLLPTMGSTAAQGKKKGAVTSPQTLLRGHSDAALALEGAATPAPPITHNSTRLQGGESPQSNRQTASLTHHHHTPLYPPPLSATQPAHAGTTHSNIDATGGNTEGAAAQQPAPPPAAASPFDVAGEHSCQHQCSTGERE
ncbi:hypothetical protein DUNSADRAFT_7883 [Dunaliella salina]|uniref:Uncharacterized protein n=1 Tax=Dunaliella salina TaxID=3046 RepID=A0ABQ7FT41_DUNSA|nr:hypothetical protein DUNSADRAFT_7883 [Dunaliella salina]|eukprot:KAF5825643.1 hypothetical protein DUNSADRAFT_7883 [Dunaliella salina]